MKITHITIHAGFARVHYSDGARLIVSVNEAAKLADQYKVSIVAA